MPGLPQLRGLATIPDPMAGSPLKRARKQGIRLDDGGVIASPYMPRRADLPLGWRHFTTERKIEHLIGLDRCPEILSWGSIPSSTPLRCSSQTQVMRVLLSIGVKAVLDGTLERELPASESGSASSESLRPAFGSGP
jgi:hypothetical protein